MLSFLNRFLISLKDAQRRMDTSDQVSMNIMRGADGRPSKTYFEVLSQATHLPPELVVHILDLAGVWSVRRSLPENKALATVTNSKRVLVSTPPLSFVALEMLRGIVFNFTSKDQGWSSSGRGRGTYENSWTWFEAVITSPAKNNHDVSEIIYTHELQRNIHAGDGYKSYCILIDQDHELFAHIVTGASLALYACAQFPGWVNKVESCSIELLTKEYFD